MIIAQIVLLAIVYLILTVNVVLIISEARDLLEDVKIIRLMLSGKDKK